MRPPGRRSVRPSARWPARSMGAGSSAAYHWSSMQVPTSMPDGQSPADAPKRALITGITGQDGSYLAELLLAQGLRGPRPDPPVELLLDRSDRPPLPGSARLRRRLFLHYADLTDSSSLIAHLHRVKPDEVYNLGAQSHVKVSFEMPEFTADTAGMGTLRLLEAVRTADWPIRFYQAGSSRCSARSRDARRPRRRRSTRAARTRSPRSSPTG